MQGEDTRGSLHDKAMKSPCLLYFEACEYIISFKKYKLAVKQILSPYNIFYKSDARALLLAELNFLAHGVMESAFLTSTITFFPVSPLWSQPVVLGSSIFFSCRSCQGWAGKDGSAHC